MSEVKLQGVSVRIKFLSIAFHCPESLTLFTESSMVDTLDHVQSWEDKSAHYIMSMSDRGQKFMTGGEVMSCYVYDANRNCVYSFNREDDYAGVTNDIMRRVYGNEYMDALEEDDRIHAVRNEVLSAFYSGYDYSVNALTPEAVMLKAQPIIDELKDFGVPFNVSPVFEEEDGMGYYLNLQDDYTSTPMESNTEF